MKKIAIFSGYYLPHLGGVERYTFNLASKLKQMGYEVIIVSLRYDLNLKEIEELVHQFVTVGLTPGTYKCKSNEHIWTKVEK